MKYFYKQQFIYRLKWYIPNHIQLVKQWWHDKNYIGRIKNWFKFGVHYFGFHDLPQEVINNKSITSATCTVCGHCIEIYKQKSYDLPNVAHDLIKLKKKDLKFTKKITIDPIPKEDSHIKDYFGISECELNMSDEAKRIQEMNRLLDSARLLRIMPIYMPNLDSETRTILLKPRKMGDTYGKKVFKQLLEEYEERNK